MTKAAKPLKQGKKVGAVKPLMNTAIGPVKPLMRTIQ